MKDTRIASRYAKSLLVLAVEQGELESIYKDMQLLYETCQTSRDLLVLLKTPIVKTDKKIEILKAIFGEQINKLSFSFIEIVTKKKRDDYLYAIAKSFLEQYKEYKNILTTVIISAIGLDDTLRKKVIEIVQSSTNSEIELVEHVSKNLIGGFILKVGDKQIDASILHQLKTLQRNFREKPYIK